MRDRLRLRPPLVALLACAPVAASAQENPWSITVTPLYLQTSGNDPDVLRIERSGRAAESVALEADDTIAYRAEVRRAGPTWSWGVDFFWHRTDQEAGPISESGGAGGLAFELPAARFVAAGPGTTLYYQVLEDTTIETWASSGYAARALAGSERGALGLRLGLKVADFDNDYRAIGGSAGGDGLRIDASSNYDRMHGPLVGLEGSIDFGRSRLDASLCQSVVFTSVELSVLYRDFTGVHSETTTFTNPRRFSKSEDVTLPVTDLHVGWSFDLTESLALGLAAEFSAFWDLPLPPGIVAAEPPFAEREETVTFLGLGASITLRF